MDVGWVVIVLVAFGAGYVWGRLSVDYHTSKEL
jgi:hypothetical protein